ncbi:MAG: hypothetical protein WC869_00050 [Phycisphaerae bacterium]|jgi:hypothetical protein
MKTHLTFNEAVLAIESASFVILMHPMNGEPIVSLTNRWEEEGDEESNYVIEPEGCDALYLNPKDVFKLTSDNRGFFVPGHSLMVFPQKPYNFQESK